MTNYDVTLWRKEHGGMIGEGPNPNTIRQAQIETCKDGSYLGVIYAYRYDAGSWTGNVFRFTNEDQAMVFSLIHVADNNPPPPESEAQRPVTKEVDTGMSDKAKAKAERKAEFAKKKAAGELGLEVEAVDELLDLYVEKEAEIRSSKGDEWVDMVSPHTRDVVRVRPTKVDYFEFLGWEAKTVLHDAVKVVSSMDVKTVGPHKPTVHMVERSRLRELEGRGWLALADYWRAKSLERAKLLESYKEMYAYLEEMS